MTGLHRDTICRLLGPIGSGCASLLDERTVNRGCERLEMDELWSLVGKKPRHAAKTDNTSRLGTLGPIFAIDAGSKLIPSFLVGNRDA